MLRNLVLKRILVSSTIILAGCAINTGVVQIGRDTFMVSRQAATGFSGSGDLKTKALEEANQYCASQRKSLQVLHVSEASPPYVFGNFPKSEVQFMCLEEAQQAAVSAKLPVMQSDVDTVTIARPSVKKNAYAVVVGIEGYRENLPKADFAAHDAKLMGEYLIKVLGYPEENVVVRLNEKATRTDLEKYVESWLVNHVEKDSSVFIYFSGHGAPDPKTSNAYLVPYDGDPAFIDKTGYPLKRLYEYLGKLPAKEVVVVLDSCFSGTGGRSVIAEGTRPMLLSIENPVLTGGRTVVLAASSGSQVSSAYKEKGHGLLTYFVLKGLRGEADQNKDGNIDLSELFEYAKPQIERTARREFNNEQTPQLLGNPEMLRRGIRLVERAVP